MIWITISVIIIALDQIAKYVVMNNIRFGSLIEIIHGFFYLTYIKNSGAAWGIFKNGRYIFILLTLIVSGAIIYLLIKSKNNIQRLSFCLILGGAVGNLIDRVFRVEVVDFLEFHFGSYTFPVFNIADICVVIGTILLGFYILFIQKEDEKVND